MSTKEQRAEILRLLKKVEYDRTTLTYQHRTLGVADADIGRPVEWWIDGLTVEQASSTIRKLRNMSDERSEDEE